jgi:23S rRNA pseudouridine955/2504/2580 synthase
MEIINPNAPRRKRPVCAAANKPKTAAKPVPAANVVIGEDDAGRRVDNFLLGVLRPLPRPGVYRLLRTGQARVNGGRVAPSHKLKIGDTLRIPPHRAAADSSASQKKPPTPTHNPPPVLFEDDDLLVINKPAGLAAHGGSGLRFGVIELLRAARRDARFLELIHRLDRDTSGLLMLAKKPAALRRIHAALREGEVKKEYLAAVCGRWQKKSAAKIDAPLRKTAMASGERRMRIAPSAGGDDDKKNKQTAARAALTHTALIRQWKNYALLRVRPATGRTHQIRAHLAFAGLPIAGDDKYGDFARNRALSKAGLERMFLHAAGLRLVHPTSGERLEIKAPPPAEFAQFADFAEAGENHRH